MSSYKKVLLYLGKFPAYGFDVDGGSILAKQLIDTLKNKCILDIVFIRKNYETYEDESVNSIRYVEYVDAFNNKFIRRLKNLETNREALKYYKVYDIIITAHISKFFGMESYEDNFWGKTILFPMFCSPSYLRAGEKVPEEYTILEKKVLKKVCKVITPSEAEAHQLLEYYDLNPMKLNVIPRGILNNFKYKKNGGLNSPLKLVYIGSIKPQKNNIQAFELLKILLDNNIDAELHFIGTVQDSDLFKKIKQASISLGIETKIKFHHELEQQEISMLLRGMDINISVSNWETFGRGIYEGISSGLPTFLFSSLQCTKALCNDNLGVFYSDNILEMANQIIDLVHNQDRLETMRKDLLKIADKVSYSDESKQLLETIFGN